MLELSETYARLHDLHPVRELDADGDFLADVCHFVGRVLERMPDRIMHLTLLTNLLSLCLNRLVFIRTTSDRNGINSLIRLAVPFVESWEIRSSSARLPIGTQELRALRRIPLSRYSSEGPQPGTETKGSQNLYYCISFVSFLKRAQRYHFPTSYTRRQN